MEGERFATEYENKAFKQYFQILNVGIFGTEKDIKKAYRMLAKKYHPDVGGDMEKFIEIKEAYEVLNDPEKREGYLHQLFAYAKQGVNLDRQTIKKYASFENTVREHWRKQSK